MIDKYELYENPEKKITEKMDKNISTFDELKASSKFDRIGKFHDIKKKESDSSIKTFDDIRENARSADQRSELSKEFIEASSSKRFLVTNEDGRVDIPKGRHRVYVSISENYHVPIKYTEVKSRDEKFIRKEPEFKYASFDKNLLESDDLQNLMREHDFEKWSNGEIDHKKNFYNDFKSEIERYNEWHEYKKNGYSDEEIGDILGKEHVETYKRFHELDPIEIEKLVKK